jgi:exodeoxyribonuclease V alpha subunit
MPAAPVDGLHDVPAQGLSGPQTLAWLNLWTDQSLLRHIDSAFAAQLLRLDYRTSAPLLVAAALLAQIAGECQVVASAYGH